MADLKVDLMVRIEALHLVTMTGNSMVVVTVYLKAASMEMIEVVHLAMMMVYYLAESKVG